MDYLKALVMSFRLNEAALVKQVFEGIPYTNVALLVEELPIVYVPRLLRFVALQTEESPHLEFCLLWTKAILDSHGQWIGDNRGMVEAEMRTVHRAVGRIRDDLRRLADDNIHMLDFLLSQPAENVLIETFGKRNTTANSHDMEIDDMGKSDDAEWIGLD
jgi:periodic tryptophan protein 2